MIAGAVLAFVAAGIAIANDVFVMNDPTSLGCGASHPHGHR